VERGVKTVPEVGYFIDVWLALATSFVQGSFKFGNERREGVGALVEGI
jgi:hypothetical protein